MCNGLLKPPPPSLHPPLALSPLVSEAATPRHKSYFGEGTGLIFLNWVACSGNDERLIDCRHNGFEETLFCSHRDDAGVSCLRKFHSLLVNVLLSTRQIYASQGSIQMFRQDELRFFLSEGGQSKIAYYYQSRLMDCAWCAIGSYIVCAP